MFLQQIDKIIISENRQRKQFPREDNEELKNSICSKGLLHAPVVQNDGITLVAGERRLRAVTELHKEGRSFKYAGQTVSTGFIPTTRLGELSPFELREAELEENIVRLDLSWQERTAAHSELHKLRSEQKEAVGAAPQTITDTAREIYGLENVGGHVSNVHEAILLQEHMHIPEIAKAKSQKEAVKVLRKIKEQEHRVKLAEVFDATSIPHTLLNGSALDLLPTLPSDFFDCILTDPPYGINADGFGDMSSTGHNYTDNTEYAFKCYESLAKEGFRAAKPQAHLYAFCDISMFEAIRWTFEQNGWIVWPRPLIWAKSNGMLPRPEHGPRNTYECILFANKGDRKTLCVRPDVILISSDGKLLHGAQKPVSLYSDLLARTCLPGNTVLDPFGGSGTILPAANQMKCTATYIELHKENYAIAVSRVNETGNDEIELTI